MADLPLTLLASSQTATTAVSSKNVGKALGMLELNHVSLQGYGSGREGRKIDRKGHCNCLERSELSHEASDGGATLKRL